MRSSSVFTLLIVLALAVTSVTHAQQLDTQSALDLADRSLGERLKKSWAPGAVITVVQGGRVVALKGYGVADIERRSAIDPAVTLFRIGSITKLMTAVAALRMSERGELDLDADLNTYLRSIHIPETFPQPVTARALMIHHGGFETQIFHLAVSSDEGAAMSPTEMQREVVRLRPVSAPPVYDNLGFGVLGIALSDIAREPFEQVLTQEVFAPLGMRQSHVGVPPGGLANAARCHMPDAGGHAKTCPAVIIRVFGQGAGDVSATASDMGRFMTGLLEAGRLLEPQALARMMNFDTQRFHPLMEGLGLAIVEMTYAGRRGAGHRGEVNGFTSKLVLFPSIDAGVFVSVNGSQVPPPLMRLSRLMEHNGGGVPSLTPDDLIDGLLDDFAAAFVPMPAAPAYAALEGSRTKPDLPTAQLAGAYFRTDLTNSLLGGFLAPLSAIPIRRIDDNSLQIMGAGPYVRRAPMYYERAPGGPGPVAVAFDTDARGDVIVAGTPYAVLQRQPWYAQASWVVLPLPLLIVLQLTSAYQLLRRRPASARSTSAILLGSALLFVTALFLELQFGHEFARQDDPAFPPLLWRLTMPVALAGMLYGVYRAGRLIVAKPAVQEPRLATATRLHFSLLVLSGLALVVLSLYWRMPALAWR